MNLFTDCLEEEERCENNKVYKLHPFGLIYHSGLQSCTEG